MEFDPEFPVIENAVSENQEEEDIYYYHTDHLGSSSWITYTDGSVTQHNLCRYIFCSFSQEVFRSENDYKIIIGMQNLPFGEPFIDQRATSYDIRFIPIAIGITGKEMDSETGYQYFGARYYDSDLSVWLSVDPASEMCPSTSPFMYVRGNPIALIDPNGMWDDDYFNKKGEYLGSDNANTDKVRIIGQKKWDDNKTINDDGTETIDHKIGVNESNLHSESGISEEASLKVYNHYNQTGLELFNLGGDKAGMQLTNEKDLFGYSILRIGIRMASNNLAGFCDQANDIISMFVHEGKHYSDLKEMGIKKMSEMLKTKSGRMFLERRAIHEQINHESFKKGSEAHQLGVYKYAVKNGYPVISKTQIKQHPITIKIKL